VATTIIREFTLCAKITFVLLYTHSNNSNKKKEEGGGGGGGGEEEEYNCLIAAVRPVPNSYILEDVHPPLQCELYTELNNAKDVYPVPSFT
jgi:hypothetical protein